MIPLTRPTLPPFWEYVWRLHRVWKNCWLTNNGELLRDFERRLSYYLDGVALAVVVNGTIGLQIIFRTMRLKGEVITTPFTFAATTNALLWERLTPVFADVDRETYNLNPESVAQRLTSKTSAILATHVFGNPCDIVGLRDIAERHGLKLIFDAAHAFGVTYQSLPVVCFGDASMLSFHATKIFHTIEGGAIVFRCEKDLETARLLRNHGIVDEEHVKVAGTNGKMNEIQAAMGLCNLNRVPRIIEERRKIYNLYKTYLQNSSLRFQKLTATTYNYSYMPVCFPSQKVRDRVYAALRHRGIMVRKYFYPLTCGFDYFSGFYSEFFDRVETPCAKDIAERVLCLPLYPGLSKRTVAYISELVQDF